MKYLLPGLAVILLFLAASCRKTSFINSPDATVEFSADTLQFNTVFTTTGSVTQSIKIFNLNDKKLKLSTVKLMGGASSAFKINVDGTPGVTFSDLELEPNDSVYIFVSVTINPNLAYLPFIVQDSILVNYNGSNRYIQLQAFGQNAHFFNNKQITKDTTWSNNLPFVITGGITVDSNVTLTIQKGCKIYSHANAPFIVNGTLLVNGEANDSDRVVFQGDRIDPYYRRLPAGWPGIFFTSSSRNNFLNFAIIKNAFQGIITSFPSASNNPKITFYQCIIDNVSDAGIKSFSSSIKAVNCLISNCGSNISITGGGNYSFDHCTVATYDNLFITHKNPVLFISNADSLQQSFALSAQFRNCIFYGEGNVDDEIIIDKQNGSGAFNAVFQNVLYKNKTEPAAAIFTNSIQNQLPDFDSINVEKGYFNFHLKPASPAVGAGINLGVPFDLDGNARLTTPPDVGCYQH